MATYTSTTSWLWSAWTTWVWWVKPPSNWNHKIIIASWHTVEFDEAVWIYWDDTDTWIQVNWTLKRSRIISTKLTTRWDLVVWALWTYDSWTELDPIPLSVLCELELNDSATQASNKWGLRNDENSTNWAWIRTWWATKTRFTEVVWDYVAWNTVITMSETTNWQVWDLIVIDTSMAWSFQRFKISLISGNIITLSGWLWFDKPNWTKVINISSNVKIYWKNWNTYASYFSIKVHVNHTTTWCVEIWETEIYCSSYTSANIYKSWNLCLTWNSTSTVTDVVKKIYRPIIHDVWTLVWTTTTSVTAGWWQAMQLFWNQAYRYTIDEPIMSISRYAFSWHSWTNTEITNMKAIYLGWVVAAWYSQWPVWCSMNWWYISNSSQLITSTGVKVNVENVTFNALLNMWSQTAFWEFTLKNCIFWPLWDLGASNSAYFNNGSLVPYLLDWCTFQATWTRDFSMTRWSSNLSNVADQFFMKRRNINNDVTLQEIYIRWWKVSRNNAIYKNSLSSIQFDSWYSSQFNIYSYTVSATANQTMRILWKVKYNTEYWTTNPATLTISWNGITPVVYTCPTSWADTWYPIDLIVTNANNYPWDFTFTFRSKSSANTETASVWFAWITIPDFITVNRHYGFKFLNLSYQLENEFITEADEIIVSAYTGISINHLTNTITLSSNHSIQELYDYIYYDLTLNNNLDKSEYFTTNDWATFNTTYNIVNNAILSWTWTLITTWTISWSWTIPDLVTKDSVWVRCKIITWWDLFSIKWATISYLSDITEIIIKVAINTNVSFVMWRLGYKPQLITINSWALGWTYDIVLEDITSNVNTALDVTTIISNTTTTVDWSWYHIYFNPMTITFEQMKATVHRLQKYENYLSAVLVTWNDNIVRILSDEIKINSPLFFLERSAWMLITDRVQLDWYLNVSWAVIINPAYIINPADVNWLYVTYLTVKPAIDVNYLVTNIESSTILAKEATLNTKLWTDDFLALK